MIFFRKLTMWNVRRCWSVCNSPFWISIFFGLLLLIHGLSFGISDDEAYYWVLGKKPAWGYAFHPPMVAWIQSIFQGIFGLWRAEHSHAVIRVPSAIFSTLIVWLGLKWINQFNQKESQGFLDSFIPTLRFLSFSGIFAMSWMWVPDLPLLFGWMLLFFVTSHQIQLTENFKKISGSNLYLFLGACLVVLSKFSGILAIASSALCLIWLSPPSQNKKSILFSLYSLLLGMLLGMLPSLYWNATHEWGSLLYQFKDRHGGSLSLTRYLRFWMSQLVLVGPGIFIFSLFFCRQIKNTIYRYALLWFLPAGLFLIQPLASDFKPHWAFVAWLPLVLVFATVQFPNRLQWLSSLQIFWGFFITALITISCQLPMIPWAYEKIFPHRPFHPLWDVSNDLYGWNQLKAELLKTLSVDDQRLPVLGSWYQTAAQASLALGPDFQVTLLPRDKKSYDEWPTLGVSENEGPHWPSLKQAALYLNDQRYNTQPQYPNTQCQVIQFFEFRRFKYLAKRIDVWKCVPNGPQR